MDTLQALTNSFESRFGDPMRASNSFSYPTCAELDNRSAFPADIAASLDDWGLPRYYVPASFGGELVGFDEPFHIMRLVARRDLTVAIGHGKTMLGAVSAWVAGADAQCRAVATIVLQNEVVSLALTEREHGSDVSASSTYATLMADHYLLNGEKYLINNATRCTLVTVFARTATAHGGRDFSLFLVDKTALPMSSFSVLPKSLTHGIKGADISGIRFNNAPVAADAIIGGVGRGLEVVLKGFQITRTLCAALCCGAGDHALRLAARFAAQRQLYGKTLGSLPIIRRTLGQACADVLVADVVGLFASRAINVLPGQMSVISAAVKAFVPPRIEFAVESLVDVLGARAYVDAEGEYVSFAKLLRDCRLVSMFDGNTVVNLQALMLQLGQIGRRRGQAEPRDASLRALFDLGPPCPPLVRGQLALSSRGQDTIVSSVLDAKGKLSEMTGVAEDVAKQLQSLTGFLIERLIEVDLFFRDNVVPARKVGKPYFDMAESYCKVFAASCCIQAFLYNRGRVHATLRDGAWLAECLTHLLDPARASYETLLQNLDVAVRENVLISIFPFSLARELAEEVHP